jgi:hypothetical protein
MRSTIPSPSYLGCSQSTYMVFCFLEEKLMLLTDKIELLEIELGRTRLKMKELKEKVPES